MGLGLERGSVSNIQTNSTYHPGSHNPVALNLIYNHALVDPKSAPPRCFSLLHGVMSTFLDHRIVSIVSYTPITRRLFTLLG